MYGTILSVSTLANYIESTITDHPWSREGVVSREAVIFSAKGHLLATRLATRHPSYSTMGACFALPACLSINMILYLLYVLVTAMLVLHINYDSFELRTLVHPTEPGPACSLVRSLANHIQPPPFRDKQSESDSEA
jgi:hypothetical protein